MECVPSRVGKGWEISITGSGGLSGERKERSSTGFQSEAEVGKVTLKSNGDESVKR